MAGNANGKFHGVNDGKYALRLQEAEGAFIRVLYGERRRFKPFDLFAGVTETDDRARDLAFCLGVERLALLEAKKPRQVIGTRLNNIGDAMTQFGAIKDGHLRDTRAS